MTQFYEFNNKIKKPSIVESISKMADFSNIRERYLELFIDKNADYKAILSDWITVGEDIYYAIEISEKESADNA